MRAAVPFFTRVYGGRGGLCGGDPAPLRGMKHAALAGLLALAGFGVWWMVGRDADAPAVRAKAKGGDRSKPAAPGDPAAEASEPGDGDLEGRVAALESEVAALRRQIGGLQAARAGFAAAPDDDEVEADARPVEGFAAAVREVLAEEREREQVEEDERRAERWEQRMEERLDELSEAGVTIPQREAIAKLWELERERVQPLMAAARRGERDFQEVRDEIDGARKETDDAVAKLIDAKQLELYTDMRTRGPGGRDRDRDRGPRPE
jgi:hypothetical protein